ncbi:MAG: UPF0147 family protein [Candidatus Micrarchaeota archaeon]
MPDELLTPIIEMLDLLNEDTSVPRNVRSVLAEAKAKLKDEKEEFVTRVSGAIYSLDEVSNDINLPMHARTMIWNLLSELESMKEKELDN